MAVEDTGSHYLFNGMVLGLMFVLGIALAAKVWVALRRRRPAARAEGAQTKALLFVRIAGFDAISERLDAEGYTRLLDEYLRAMTRLLRDQHGARVEKYIGDVIVATWNAAEKSAEASKLAGRLCAAGIGCRSEFAALKERWAASGAGWWKALGASGDAMDLQIGGHLGQAMEATLGDPEVARLESFGDAVGLARWMMKLCADLGAGFLVTQWVYLQGREGIAVREAECVRVAGKLEPITVFEVLCPRGQLTDKQSKVVDAFHAGLVRFRQQKWQEAGAAFDAALAMDPGDGPSLVYRRRVEAMASEAGPEHRW